MDRRCVECKLADSWLLQLRNCGHLTCVGCGLRHLKRNIKGGKALVKCLKHKCPEYVHDNDVAALLDVDNQLLDDYMNKEHRQALQLKHDRDVVGYALGGPTRVRACPKCKEQYGQESGCNYVRCANKPCQTWFCWSCGQETDSWQHFGTNVMCRVSWNDIYQATWLFRFLITTDPICLYLLTPLVWIILFIGVPSFIVFGFPYYRSRRRLRLMREQERPRVLMWLWIVLLMPVRLIAGLLLACMSICWVFGLWYAYAALILAKFVPGVDKVFNFIDLLTCAMGLLGLDEWQKILRDSKEARENMLIEQEQAALEQADIT